MVPRSYNFFILLASVSHVSSSLELTDQQYASMPSLYQFDDFDNCFLHEDQTLYCKLTLTLKPNNPKNTSKVWKLIENLSSDKNNFRHDHLRYGVCVPESCPKTNSSLDDTLTQCYQHQFDHLDLTSNISKINCEGRSSKYVVGWFDIYFAVVVGVYVVFVLFISFFLNFLKSSSKEKHQALVKTSVGKFLQIFSLFQNWKYLVKIPEDLDKDFLSCLQGIRFAGTVVVIITHAVEVNLITPVRNPRFTEEIAKGPLAMVLANGQVMIQIYFVMTYWLLASKFTDKYKKSEGISLTYILRCILSRYVRLTPALALLIGLHSTWLVHWYRGPFWDEVIGEEYRVCRRMWWTNLLYFNNFLIPKGLCLFHSWYLSADIQFFIFGILMLWMMQKCQKLLMAAVVLLTCLHVIIASYLFYVNNWEMVVRHTPELLYLFNVIYSHQWRITWGATFSHIAGFALGLAFGHFYSKNKGQQLFTKKHHNLLWWIVSWGCILIPVAFPAIYLPSDFYEYRKWLATIYGGLSKPMFAFGSGLLILGISQGLGGVVKRGFEWTPMYSLAQLSYGAFLVHFTVLKVRVAMRQTPLYMSYYFLISEILTNITMSYIFSAVLTLFVQMPCTLLSKWMA